MSKHKILIEAILDGASPLKDGGVSLRFHTQESSREYMVEMMQLYQTFGWLLFQPNEIQTEDIPPEEAERRNYQSPSKKMFNTLYAYYKLLNMPYGASGFQKWRDEQMEVMRQGVLDEMRKLEKSRN